MAMFRRVMTSVAAVVIAAAGGCLEREERITIRPDLSAELVSEFKGEVAEFTGGDALPEAGGAWKVEDRADPKDANKRTRTATLSVPPGGEIPGSYATDGASEEVSLKFPTKVVKEVRREGTAYHFSRVYRAREDGAYTVAKRDIENNPEISKLADANPEELSTEARGRLLEAFRAVELEKNLRFVRAGTQAIGRAQDSGLRIREAVVNAGRAFDLTRAMTLISLPQSDDRDEQIAALGEEFETTLEKALSTALERERLTSAETEAFRKGYLTERRRREVTEDLRDERWVVRVRMPGRVIGHNADSVEGDELVWEFSATGIMDADREIMATSLMENGGK